MFIFRLQEGVVISQFVEITKINVKKQHLKSLKVSNPG